MEPGKTALVLIEFQNELSRPSRRPLAALRPQLSDPSTLHPSTCRDSLPPDRPARSPCASCSFTSEGGKLHGAVQGVMASSGMLANARAAMDAARQRGALIVHVPITCGFS